MNDAIRWEHFAKAVWQGKLIRYFQPETPRRDSTK
jgi:hypothetical protein